RKIADLAVRTAANNEALAELNRDRSAGVMEHLLSAELQARGLDSFTRDMPSLLNSVVLFDWDTGRPIWPPPRPSLAAAFVATSMVPAYNPTDWHKDERRAKAQQQERKLMARTSREQEERENREARERFAESQRKRLI